MTAGNVATYVVVVLFALSTSLLLQPPALVTKKQLLRSLTATAGAGQGSGVRVPRVAIGYNANVDVIAPAVALFRAAGLDPEVPARDVDVIRDKSDLSAAFRHFFASAAAGERTLANAELLDELVRRAKELPGGEDGAAVTQSSVGGNAALMGLQFARLGCEVMLGGKVRPPCVFRWMLLAAATVGGQRVVCDVMWLRGCVAMAVAVRAVRAPAARAPWRHAEAVRG